MAELFNLQQAETVAAYLSREIIAKGAPQKLVRVDTQVAIGPEQYHTKVAEAAGLKLIEVERARSALTDEGCHDGAKLEYFRDTNRLAIYGITTLRFITPLGDTLTDLEHADNILGWFEQVEACRQVTCSMFVAAVNLLPSRPELFSTIDDHPDEAVLFRS